jgi:hypothetical protein
MQQTTSEGHVEMLGCFREVGYRQRLQHSYCCFESVALKAAPTYQHYAHELYVKWQ